MSKTGNWHMEEEWKLLEDKKKGDAFEKAFKDGFESLEELHGNYMKYVYELTRTKIDKNEARWDCETFDLYFDFTNKALSSVG